MLKVGCKSFLIACAYAVAYVLLREGSASHWLLPAGLRYTALLFLPFRWWPAILVGDIAGSLFYRASGAPAFGYAWLTVSLLGPLAASALPAYVLRSIRWGSDPGRLATSVAHLLTGGLVASVLSAGFGVWALSLMHLTSEQHLAEPMRVYFSMFTIGDYLGVLVIAPIVFTSYPKLRRKLAVEHALSNVSLQGFVWSMALATIFLAVLLRTAETTASADMRALARVCMLAPVVFLTIRHGWLGAVPMVFLGNLALQATMPEVRSTELVSVQFLMALVGSAMLALGAIATELQTRNSRLSHESHKHLELARTNLRWGEMRSMQAAVVLESAFSRFDDGHEELPNLFSGRPSTELARTRWHSGLMLRREVERQVESLRLTTLHTDGLALALQGGPLRTTLDDAGVKLALRVSGNADALPADMQVLLYRISQEFILRLVRDHRAKRVRVRVLVGGEHGRSAALVVRATAGKGQHPRVPPPFATSYEIKSIAETYRGHFHDRSRSKRPTLSVLLHDS